MSLQAFRFALVVTLLLSPPPAPAREQTAAESPDEEPMMSEEEEILVEDTLPYLPDSNTIVTKLPLPIGDTPASVGVVTAPLIEEQRAVVLGDALPNVSGLNVQTGNGVFDFFVVRGFDSISSAMIMTDGTREPESSFYQLYNVDRVEVLKGPSSFLYGGSPLAGVVNLVRKQPLPAAFGSVSVTGGSYGTLEGMLDWNLANEEGSLSFRLNSLYRESDGYRDDKASRVTAVNPALTWIPDDATRLNVTYEHVSAEHRSDAGLPLIGGITVPPVPRERSYQSPFDISDQNIDRVQLDYERTFGDGAMLRSKLSYRNLEWLSKGTLFVGVFPNAAGSLEALRLLGELDDEQTFFGGQFEYLTSVATGSVVHNLLFGLEVTQLEDAFTFVPKALPSIDLFHPVETARRPLFPIPGQDLAADAESLVVAPYVVDQITLSDRVRLLVGGRWDSIDFDEAVLATSRDDGEFNPLLGIVVEPSPEVSIYANAGTAFAAPSTFGLEEDRVPEESTAYELGVKGTLFRDVDASVAIYRLERENVVIPDPTGVRRQVGDQLSRGLEIEVAARLGRRSRILGSYAYTDSELTSFTEFAQVAIFPPVFAFIDHSGNSSPFAPEHLLSLWYSQSFDSGFGYGAGARYVDEQFISENNLFEIDSYGTLDASVFYRLGDWRISLAGKNLTGEEYLTRGFGAASVIPAPEASGYLTLEYDF